MLRSLLSNNCMKKHIMFIHVLLILVFVRLRIEEEFLLSVFSPKRIMIFMPFLMLCASDESEVRRCTKHDWIIRRIFLTDWVENIECCLVRKFDQYNTIQSHESDLIGPAKFMRFQRLFSTADWFSSDFRRLDKSFRFGWTIYPIRTDTTDASCILEYHTSRLFTCV